MAGMPVVPALAPAPQNVDSEIAAFIAAGEAKGDVAPGAEAPEEPAEAAAPAADPEPVAEVEAAPAKAAPSLDVAAITKAVDAGDVKGLIAALGDKADALLGAGAHRVLRLQANEANRAVAEAVKQQKAAQALGADLMSKYADPVDMRLAGERGDVDGFITLLEKNCNATVAQVLAFIGKGQAGREVRLEQKRKDDNAAAATTTAQQQQAQTEARNWVTAGVTKLDPVLVKECPEAIDEVIAEIKAGFAKGITTPAKALPAARERLKARWERLNKLFGPGAKKAAKAASPNVAAAATGGTTRKLSLDEEIQQFTKENKYV